MPRVLNCHRDFYRLSNVIPIMRPSKWGNPFKIGKDGSREEVINKYREWLMSKPKLIFEAKRELKGKDLLCCCAPKSCHGDILLEVANSEDLKVIFCS